MKKKTLWQKERNKTIKAANEMFTYWLNNLQQKKKDNFYYFYFIIFTLKK